LTANINGKKKNKSISSINLFILCSHYDRINWD
jgi:hypothetical protein